MKNIFGQEFVKADEIDREDLPRRKSSAVANMQKAIEEKNKVISAQDKEIARLRGINDKNYQSSGKNHSSITFSYGNNRIAYWKDGYWYDDITDEEVPDKWSGKVSPDYKKTSNDSVESEDIESEGEENE